MAPPIVVEEPPPAASARNRALPPAVDEVLAAGTAVDACDEQVRQVGPHEMISFGYSNRTPWQTPRELDESGLRNPPLNDLAAILVQRQLDVSERG